MVFSFFTGILKIAQLITSSEYISISFSSLVGKYSSIKCFTISKSSCSNCPNVKSIRSAYKRSISFLYNEESKAIRLFLPQHFLNFFPLPQGHGSFRLGLLIQLLSLFLLRLYV